MKWNDKLNQEQLQGNQDPKHVLNPEPADGTVRKCRLHYQGPVSLFVNFGTYTVFKLCPLCVVL